MKQTKANGHAMPKKTDKVTPLQRSDFPTPTCPNYHPKGTDSVLLMYGECTGGVLKRYQKGTTNVLKRYYGYTKDLLNACTSRVYRGRRDGDGGVGLPTHGRVSLSNNPWGHISDIRRGAPRFIGAGYVCAPNTKGQTHRTAPTLLSILIFVFVSCLFNNQSFAQSRDSLGTAERQTQLVYNHALYQLIDVSYFEDDGERSRYPNADFEKYPMARYHVNMDGMKTFLPGDELPEQFLDMPLWVINDKCGRDTVTLRSYTDKKWIIIDFWAEWCTACVASMKKWEDLQDSDNKDFQLLGAYRSYYTHRAAIETEKRGWSGAQVIGPAQEILFRAFLGNSNVMGPSIWLKDGRLFGISNANSLTDEDYQKILSGALSSIPDHASYKHLSNTVQNEK